MKDKKYLAKVKNLPCCICGACPPSDPHHKKEFTGIALKSSDYDAMPLCYEHHIGNTGIHGLGRKEFERRYGLQSKLVERTRRLLGYEGV